jgi:phytoene dehydrogenase-like protein
MGVEILLGSPVEQVKMKNRRVIGIHSGGKDHPADIIVSDVDIVKAYDLFPGIRLKKRYLKHERSTSAMIFYWGMKGDLPSLDLHNIFFSEDYPEEFRFLFEEKSIYSDPTVYVYISSVQEKGDAPSGGQNWFVMINTPENIGQDWSALRDYARTRILEKLERMLDFDLAGKIETEELLDPVLIENRTSSWRGSLYGISSNNRLAAFSRHPNFSRTIKGLYFVGGSVHPGGGIPLCLASAKIVDCLVNRELPRQSKKAC